MRRSLHSRRVNLRPRQPSTRLARDPSSVRALVAARAPMIRTYAHPAHVCSRVMSSSRAAASCSRSLARGVTARVVLRGAGPLREARARTTSGRRKRDLSVRAERETRLASVLTSLPQRFNLYFARKAYRTTLWRGISAYFGFYLANVLTLSFGAIGINDVVAGALSVAFFEIITRIYYRSASPNRWLEFLQWFKIGYTYSLIADAFKLGS